jgi:polyhydroxyalkanoate synthesis regulator protein
MPGFEAMKRQQEAFIKAMTAGWPGTSAPAREDDAPTAKEELAQIKRQLAELQAKLAKL